MVMDAEPACQRETDVLVKVDVALHAEEAHPFFPGPLQRILQETESVALPLIVGMDADRTEGPGGFARTVRKHQFGLGEHHMADDLPVFLHHEIQFRDKVRVIAILIQHIMLRASGAIDIPKSLPREILHFAVIGRCFKSDVHILQR